MADPEQLDRQFAKRNENLRHTIDVLAEYEPEEIDEHGAKQEISEEHDIERYRIYYVLSNWRDLVRHRRAQNRDPLDPDAVKAAYEDETMQAMAEGRAVADGMGDVTITVEMPLDEAFRAIKLLPGDLGVRIFTQVIQQSGELPRSGLDALFD